MRIKDVLQHKSGGVSVVTVAPDTTVTELIALLAEHNIGAVVVSSDETPVAGIVSERDVVRLLNGRDTTDQVVADIMTVEVHTATLQDSVHELMKLMTQHRIRHVPVVEEGNLEGIVSIGDVVKSRIDELEFERDQLSSYVQNAQS